MINVVRCSFRFSLSKLDDVAGLRWRNREPRFALSLAEQSLVMRVDHAGRIASLRRRQVLVAVHGEVRADKGVSQSIAAVRNS